MGEERVYLGLGSNFPAKEKRLREAIAAINKLANLRIIGKSSVYLTEPQDNKEQPWFANMALEIAAAASWTPETLLTALLEIERDLGRVRAGIWRGPRAIDIDLLIYGDRKLATPACVVPHPRLLQRAFALAPLLELNPNLMADGRSLRDALSVLNWRREGNKIFQE